MTENNKRQNKTNIITSLKNKRKTGHTRHSVICFAIIAFCLLIVGCSDKAENSNRAVLHIDTESGFISCAIDANNYPKVNNPYLKLVNSNITGYIMYIGNTSNLAKPDDNSIRTDKTIKMRIGDNSFAVGASISPSDILLDAQDFSRIIGKYAGIINGNYADIIEIDKIQTLEVTLPSGQILKYNFSDFLVCSINLVNAAILRDKSCPK